MEQKKGGNWGEMVKIGKKNEEIGEKMKKWRKKGREIGGN